MRFASSCTSSRRSVIRSLGDEGDVRAVFGREEAPRSGSAGFGAALVRALVFERFITVAMNAPGASSRSTGDSVRSATYFRVRQLALADGLLAACLKAAPLLARFLIVAAFAEFLGQPAALEQFLEASQRQPDGLTIVDSHP